MVCNNLCRKTTEASNWKEKKKLHLIYIMEDINYFSCRCRYVVTYKTNDASVNSLLYTTHAEIYN